MERGIMYYIKGKMKYLIKYRGFVSYLIPEEEVDGFEFLCEEVSIAYRQYKKDMPDRKKAKRSRLIYELAETAVDDNYGQYRIHGCAIIEADNLRLYHEE
jgi:hypothetical protein